MYIGIRELKKSYPHIDNKDIDMVIEINQPKIYEQSVIVNNKPRFQKLYLRKEIEKIFGPIIKDY